MKWNSYDFVMSADAQFNGATCEHIDSIEGYAAADILTEYQTVVSPELGRLIPETARKFESADQATCAHIREIDHRIHFPAEFFQCMLQKPQHYVDYRNRVQDMMDLLRPRWRDVNAVLDAAFREYAAHGARPEKTIGEEVERLFRDADAELRGIVTGYLTQMPQRAIFLLDVESSPAGFDWLEPVYQTIKGRLRDFGIDFIAAVSGKGYHFIAQVPLFSPDGLPGTTPGEKPLNYAMLNLMARGGFIRPETMNKMMTVRWGSRKLAPASLLAQRAYQGMTRLQQFFSVSIVDEMRGRLAKANRKPWVNFTDSEDETVILDLTGMLRQVEMGVFGSVGSLYNKQRRPPKVRIVRSRNGHEYFNNDLAWMIRTRSDLGAVKMHLIASGGGIPDGSRGIENLMSAYDSSRMKRELHEPCDEPLSDGWVRNLFQSNYALIRRRCPEIMNDVRKAQPNFLNPKILKWVYERLAARGFSLREMMMITKAVYYDPVKKVDINPKYSKDEWCRWPALLLGEWFKG